MLLRNYIRRPVIVCAQKRAEKKIVTEADLIQSNIDGQGDSIGIITNRTTAEYAIRSKFEKGSREYEKLTFRIKAGELYQQNSMMCLWLFAATRIEKYSEPRHLGCAR